MALYPDTRPDSGDELADSFRKVNQILVSGPVGPTAAMFPNAAPSGGDNGVDSARKINQTIHNRGGV